jgi:hypothetical protein
MPRYIDADRQERIHANCVFDTRRDSQMAYDLIISAPTADVAKVRHGRWEITDAYPHWMCCSVCHKAVVRNIEVIERYEIPTSFCPNCGARMEDKQ